MGGGKIEIKRPGREPNEQAGQLLLQTTEWYYQESSGAKVSLIILSSNDNLHEYTSPTTTYALSFCLSSYLLQFFDKNESLTYICWDFGKCFPNQNKEYL